MFDRVCFRLANKAAIPACLLAVTLSSSGLAGSAMAQGLGDRVGLDSGSTVKLAVI